jgi:hypothetical protein
MAASWAASTSIANIMAAIAFLLSLSVLKIISFSLRAVQYLREVLGCFAYYSKKPFCLPASASIVFLTSTKILLFLNLTHTIIFAQLQKEVLNDDQL